MQPSSKFHFCPFSHFQWIYPVSLVSSHIFLYQNQQFNRSSKCKGGRIFMRHSTGHNRNDGFTMHSHRKTVLNTTTVYSSMPLNHTSVKCVYLNQKVFFFSFSYNPPSFFNWQFYYNIYHENFKTDRSLKKQTVECWCLIMIIYTPQAVLVLYSSFPNSSSLCSVVFFLISVMLSVHSTTILMLKALFCFFPYSVLAFILPLSHSTLGFVLCPFINYSPPYPNYLYCSQVVG